MDTAFESTGAVLERFRSIAHPDILEKARLFQIADQLNGVGLNPYFQPLARNEGTTALMKDREVLMFGSNNYLGLTHHPEVKRAVIAAVEQHGTSFTGSRLLNGTTELHLEVERNLADFLGKEDALVFATGYQTNLGVFSAILNEHSAAVIDNYSHASITDGCRLSRGRTAVYPHGDVGRLERLLEQHQNGKTGCIVVTDGLFSMHGDLAPLDKIVPLVRKHGARLLVDDAHGVGTVGPGGKGTPFHFGVEKDVDLIVGTFSKSLASLGGFVAGERNVMSFIKHFGRSMIFSAALAPPNLAAANAALNVLRDEPERVDQVNRNADLWRNGLSDLGFKTEGSTPVVPVVLGQDLLVFKMWRALLDAGVYVNAAVWPSVPQGGGLLRTSLTASHEREQIEEALGVFERVGKQLGVLA
jgi:8-amino-7-oxononanoate synthase